jgi:hypothetical protein
MNTKTEQKRLKVTPQSTFSRSVPLLWLLAMTGCMNWSSIDFSPSIARCHNAVKQLARASTFYYDSVGRWPRSSEDLLVLPSKMEMDSDSQKSYAEITNAIPWDELKDKVVFNELPNGKLSISVPQMDPMDPAATNGMVTGTVEVPKGDATARKN